ncbi:MAG TPA: putative toxin-antitoxin system toxin component, PIN family [Candidatus Tectomicrobia bacterium]
MVWLVVLDSNVLVSGLRSSRGASYQVLNALRDQRFRIAISVPLALEYEVVLRRHARELGLTQQEAIGLVDYLCAVGHRQSVHFLWRPTLRDPGDEFILELAVAAGCKAIVTHNIRHFAGAEQFGLTVLTPAAFLHRLEES